LWLRRKKLIAIDESIKKQMLQLEQDIDIYKRERAIIGDIEIEALEDESLASRSIELQRRVDHWKNSMKNFNERYNFLLSRFRRKYFYWEAMITGRKVLLSILYAFLKDIQIIVFGVVIVFIALILHFNTVPFRQKFLNLMEYIVLISTLLTLFFGLLFFVNEFPTPAWRTFAIVLTMIVIISCSVIVVLMVLFDMWTRRQKDNAKAKQRKEELEKELGRERALELRKEYKTLFPKALTR
jgi:hypothetical protein